MPLLALLAPLPLDARPASRDAEESELDRLALTAANENDEPFADCEAAAADSRPALAPETPSEFAVVCAEGRRLRTRVKEDDDELLLPNEEASPAPLEAAEPPMPLPVPPPPPIERTVSMEERYPSPSEPDAPLAELPSAEMPEPKRDDGRSGIMPLPAPPAAAPPAPAAPMVGRMIEPLVMASREPVPDAGPMLRLSVLMLPRPPDPPGAAPTGRPVGGRSEPTKAGGAVAPRLRQIAKRGTRKSLHMNGMAHDEMRRFQIQIQRNAAWRPDAPVERRATIVTHAARGGPGYGSEHVGRTEHVRRRQRDDRRGSEQRRRGRLWRYILIR